MGSVAHPARSTADAEASAASLQTYASSLYADSDAVASALAADGVSLSDLGSTTLFVGTAETTSELPRTYVHV